VVSTIYAPTEGTAFINEIDVSKDPQGARRHLGFLSSTSGLYERLTAREILQYFGRLCDMQEELLNQRIDMLLEALDFKQYADTRVAKLSQGTRQKVSIARSIIHDPLLIILDEPSTGLDVLAASAMHEFVRQERQLGKCILLSTHTMSEAEKLCDRIGVISEGRLLAVGTVEELKELTGKANLEEAFVKLVRKSESLTNAQ
jgi:sodium transport system ATP-binding protein